MLTDEQKIHLSLLVEKYTSASMAAFGAAYIGTYTDDEIDKRLQVKNESLQRLNDFINTL